jgi:hypothetical protein
MSNVKVKSGMGGSRCGKGRRERTETLKKLSKKFRRQQAKKEFLDSVDMVFGQARTFHPEDVWKV